ncbi:MAG: glutathione S-transferase family protein [Deltaproteobacteria bacterium]|nr:glutathione S-transferase family protein [Deltaproteobacteria bacterium]
MLLSPSMQLVTIPFSHYNERARWALDYFGIEYTQRSYLPVFHLLGVALATRGRAGVADGISSRWSTPLLVQAPGRFLRDSGKILRWASDTHGTPQTTLYPPEHQAAIERVEQQFHDQVGPQTRRLAYGCCLDHRGMLAKLGRDNVGWVQGGVFTLATPLVARVLRTRAGVDPHSVEASFQRVTEEVAAFDRRIDGRRYLFGDRFTAADLTVACMLSPVLIPSPDEGFAAVLPAVDVLGERWRTRVQQLRDTPTGRYVLRMFEDERSTPAGVQAP